MRILYFSQDLTPHDLRFLKSLVVTEHEIFHLRMESQFLGSASIRLPDNVEEVLWSESGRGTHRLLYPFLRSDLRSLLQQIQPDVIHAGPIQRSAFLTAFAGFHPLVSMSWGSDLLVEAQSGVGKWMAEYALNRTSVCLCDCETVREAAQQLGMPADRIIVFPWGVDLDLFNTSGTGENMRKKLKWEDNLIFISTRAWEPLYGVAELIQGFILAAAENHNIRLILTNDGSERNTIISSLEGAGVMDRVLCPGWIPESDLTAWFRTADIYLSASHSDGSSISLLEAMACGRPALVSDIPGNLEWVDPRFNGWIFPVGDVEALAAQMLSIADDPSLKESFGAKSRAIVESRANWDRNFGLLIEAYHLARSMEVAR